MEALGRGNVVFFHVGHNNTTENNLCINIMVKFNISFSKCGISYKGQNIMVYIRVFGGPFYFLSLKRGHGLAQ